MEPEEDKFWDRESDIEREKTLATWPGAFAAVGRSLIFWTAVVIIVYELATHG